MDEPKPRDPPTVRILIVDDNPDVTDSSELLLEALGYDVRSVNDPRKAVQAAKEYRPHCILSDIGMPGMDGYQLAKLFKAEESLKDTPLIAITAWAEAERAKAAGFDHHLLKPADPLALLNLLQRISGMENRIERVEKTVQEQSQVATEVRDLIKEVKSDVEEIKHGLTEDVRELKDKLDEVKEEVKELKEELKEDKVEE